MNKLVTAVALATFIASPAFAQSYDPHFGSGNIVPPPGQAVTHRHTGSAAFGAYAQVRQPVRSRTTAEKSWFDRAARPGY